MRADNRQLIVVPVAQAGPANDAEIGNRPFARGKGCEHCSFTGYRGRLALCEILTLDERTRRAILEGKSSGDIERLARESGMRTLRQAGLRAVFEGATTVDEVVRETLLDAV